MLGNGDSIELDFNRPRENRIDGGLASVRVVWICRSQLMLCHCKSWKRANPNLATSSAGRHIRRDLQAAAAAGDNECAGDDGD